MDPYGPRFDYSVMWIVTSSNGCFVLSLKTVSFHLFSVFFFLCNIVWSIRIEQNRNPKTVKPSPHSLSSLPLPHSLNYISHLCLSPLSPSQLSPNCSSLSQSLSTSLSLSLHLCLIAVTLTPLHPCPNCKVLYPF